MTQSTGQEQDRGPGAEKVELEKRLDANAKAEKKARTAPAEDPVKASDNKK